MSSRAKHTPGPWRVEISPMDEGGRRTLVLPADGDIGGKWVAMTWPREDDDEDGCTVTEAESNAKLIASSPDMLAELERVAAVFEGLASSGDDPAMAEARKVRAVIAKARATA